MTRETRTVCSMSPINRLSAQLTLRILVRICTGPNPDPPALRLCNSLLGGLVTNFFFGLAHPRKVEAQLYQGADCASASAPKPIIRSIVKASASRIGDLGYQCLLEYSSLLPLQCPGLHIFRRSKPDLRDASLLSRRHWSD